MDETALPQTQWPDPLTATDGAAVPRHLTTFWETLHHFGEVLSRGELLLADEAVARLRRTVINMMLALNGIERPAGTVHLNSYLGESQRQALERTLLRTEVSREALIGQAVALVVIYRWYAPQLVDRYAFQPPRQQEEEVWHFLRAVLFDWPATISTDPPDPATSAA